MKIFARLMLVSALLLTAGFCRADSIPEHRDSIPVMGDSIPVLKLDSLVEQKDSLSTGKKKKKDKEKDEYQELIKEGGSVQEGLFAVRHIKDSWYLEVPDELLGRLLLAVTRFSGVPQDFQMLSGEEVNRSAIYFEQYGPKTLLLREYVQTSHAKADDRIALSLRQSTVDPIVCKFEVIGRNPKTKAQLINVTKWLLSDNKITSFTAADRTEVKLGSLQADRTFVDTLKTYPINLEIGTLRTYAMTKSRVPASKSGSATLSLNTSVVLLPEEPMQPRYYDERVGYFKDKMTAFSDDQQMSDHESIVMRYRLEPKNPKAYKAGRLVEPKKQIVYYIDPATPKKWVKYLIAGINDWNKAFEKAGFKNAIVGKEWPENDTTMSVDDARFSMIRYLPSETENAYGPRIVDPRSGEIIEAHVCWYHNVMNLVRKWYIVQCGPLDKRVKHLELPDELMGQLIRFVSSHEIGHSLGLRHNMIASYATPVEKLRDKAWVERHGHTGSIMDYARFNYVAQPEDHIGEKGLFPRINDYDLWAIQWGYQWRPEFKDAAEEKKVLRAEVTKVLKAHPHLWWTSDEGRGQDPRSQTEDLSDNQMVAADYGMKNLKRVMANIEQWTAQPDDEYHDLEELYGTARRQYQRYVGHVQRYIGGRFTNHLPGQSEDEVVPRQQKQQALRWIGQNVLEAPIWLYPRSVAYKLSFNATEDIRSRQQATLSALLSVTTIQSLHDDMLRSQQAYPVEDYLNDVFALVWKAESNDRQQADFLRSQQRAYLAQIDRALNPDKKEKGSENSEAVLYLSQHLDKVEQYLKAQSSTPHIQNLLLRIERIRKAYSGKE